MLPIEVGGEMVVHQRPPPSRPPAASGWGDHCRLGIEVGYLSGFILAMNSPPVSTSVRSPECAADFIRSTDVSLCPFTVLAKGTIP